MPTIAALAKHSDEACAFCTRQQNKKLTRVRLAELREIKEREMVYEIDAAYPGLPHERKS